MRLHSLKELVEKDRYQHMQLHEGLERSSLLQMRPQRS